MGERKVAKAVSFHKETEGDGYTGKRKNMNR